VGCRCPPSAPVGRVGLDQGHPQSSPSPQPNRGVITSNWYNIAAALSYLLTWVTGIIFLVVEKDDDYVRFHAKRSIAFGVAAVAVWIGLSIFFAVMAFLPIIGSFVVGLLATLVWFAFGIGFLITWIFLIVKAYQGQRYDLPVLGDLVKNLG
jgi:uncharacterized membrane protein